MNSLIEQIRSSKDLSQSTIDDLREPLDKIVSILKSKKNKRDASEKVEEKTRKKTKKTKETEEAAQEVFEEASKFITFDRTGAPDLDGEVTSEDASTVDEEEEEEEEEEEQEDINGFETYLKANMEDSVERDLICLTLREKTDLAVLMFRHLENKRFLKSSAPTQVAEFCRKTMDDALKSTSMDGPDVLDTIFDDEERDEKYYRRSLRYVKACAFLVVKYGGALRRFKN